MAESASVSTRGGCSFEQQCHKGSNPTYSCDNVDDIRKVDKKGDNQLEEAKDIIVQKIKDNIASLEIGREERVAKLYIGKTFIHRHKIRGNRYNDLDPKKSTTWRLDGISTRWSTHMEKKTCGTEWDGMVVLTAVTKEAIPERCQDKIHQEDYAFAIEQRLLHHFLIAKADKRVVNDGFSSGGTDSKKSAAYAIYMLFSMEQAAQAPAMPASAPLT